MDLTLDEVWLLVRAVERMNRKKKWKNASDEYAASQLLQRLWREKGRQETGHGGVHSYDPWRHTGDPEEWR
jgi:hypothetical protein